MQMRDNKGQVVAEQNVAVTKEGSVISVNTMYDHSRPVAQNLGVRVDNGNVRTETVTGSKLLP